MTEFSQTYWNELLEKYRNGTISDEDRFRLEKQALDDPFLFDALEGFSLYQEAPESKRKTTGIFTFARIGIAASLVLLVAVIFNLKTNLNPTLEEDQSIAMVLGEEDAAAPNVAEVVVDSGSQKNKRVISSDTPPKPVSKVASQPEKDVTISTNISKRDDAKKAETEPSQPSKIEVGNLVVGVDPDVEQNLDQNEGEMEEEQMISEEEDVLLDEVVVVKNGDTSVDIVNATNFKDFAKEKESEMVPIGVLSEKNGDSLGNISRKKMSFKIYEAVPVIGKEIFDDYAKQRIDERGLRQEQPQKVTIEFKIDKNGNLTDFHHIFSGCPECGPFAISLLTKSGEWKTVPPGFTGKARYTFIF